ncbi:MAG: SCO family protein [Burkholderiales bacterium]|uniref:SCO family protein n=1 Tax=Pandoraea sp. TaxID=1883445 RepID=UPI001213E7D0|nr:SCO family protein [Pandoraea sp.]MDE2289934.1 SCO family protein [Burkholderiales bacterium]MDE2608601.1 SCO family protein [Burkholderiales bacterium]TAL80516.1 MAG: SCO family protein [Candidimonas sp.]TAM18959.1 MAG: SCO family protein [Pandoraea sp.]
MTEPKSVRSGRRAALRYLAFPLVAGLLAACSRKPVFKGTDISGSSLTMTVALTDDTGRRRTLADFRGKVVAVFLGYTRCPDVCPTTMGELKLAMQQLGQQADLVQVLFVTVDPEHDTLPVLARWVTGFDPRFLGLRGTQEELKALASQLKVYYGRTGKTGDDIMHNGNVFLFDRHGAIRVLEEMGANSTTLAADIRELLKED